MADFASHKGVIKIDISSSATATTDVSAGTIEFSLAPTKSIGKHHTLSSIWQQITEGGVGITLKVKTENTTTAAHINSYFKDWYFNGSGARTIELYTPDTSTGSTEISGEWVLEAPDNVMNAMAGKGDVMASVWTLHSDDTITLATI